MQTKMANEKEDTFEGLKGLFLQYEKMIDLKIEQYHQDKALKFRTLRNNFLSGIVERATELMKIKKITPEDYEKYFEKWKKSFKELTDFVDGDIELSCSNKMAEVADLSRSLLDAFSSKGSADKKNDKNKQTFIEIWKKQNPMLSEDQLEAKYEASKSKIIEIVEKNKSKS